MKFALYMASLTGCKIITDESLVLILWEFGIFENSFENEGLFQIKSEFANSLVPRELCSMAKRVRLSKNSLVNVVKQNANGEMTKIKKSPVRHIAVINVSANQPLLISPIQIHLLLILLLLHLSPMHHQLQPMLQLPLLQGNVMMLRQSMV